MLALRARVGASTLDIDFDEIRGWAPLLDSATAIYLHHDGREVVTRWDDIASLGDDDGNA